MAQPSNILSPNPQPSAWDGVRDDGSVSIVIAGRDRSTRQAARLNFLHANPLGMDDETLATTREAEIARRRAYWSEPKRHPKRHPVHPASNQLRMILLMVGIIFLVRFGLRSMFGYMVKNPILFCIPAAALLAFGIPRDMRRRCRDRLVYAITDCACPDCGYALMGLMNSGKPGFVGPGPSACPECGSAWPMVPPPVPSGYGEPPKQ